MLIAGAGPVPGCNLSFSYPYTGADIDRAFCIDLIPRHPEADRAVLAALAIGCRPKDLSPILREIAGGSAPDVIDPSRCGRRSTPRVQRGRAQDDELALSPECTVIRRIG
jgi:hypothetical protein